MLDVCLLGTGGMQPLPGRRLSATLVRVGGALMLLDCGEGTQVAVREAGWGLRNLNAILLTHLHADHALGLPGLLLTLGHAGKSRDEPMSIYGPEPLVEVVSALMTATGGVPFPLRLHVLKGGEEFEPDGVPGVVVTTLLLEHGIPCLAYGVGVPREPRFDAEKARSLDIPLSEWRLLQHGQDVTVGDRVVHPDEVRGRSRRGLRLVLATDMQPTPAVAAFLAQGDGTDLLIADGMYGDDEQKPTRWEAQHMTFAETATLARDGGARRLWLTHFSPSLSDPNAYADRAAAIFPATTIGQDGMTTTLSFDDA